MNLATSLAVMGAALSFVVAAIGLEQYQQPTSRPTKSESFRWPEGKRAAVSLSFDDARPSQVDAGIPLFDRYGVKATFYVSPSRMRERANAWKKASEAGHEIANHSLTHPCTGNFPFSRERALEDYTLERMHREMTDANAEIRNLTGVAPSTFAYPCGQKFVGRGANLKSYVPLVAELFLAGRGWLDEGPNDPLVCDLAQLLGMPSDNLDFAQIRPLIDQALERGAWLVLAGHEIAESDARQTTKLSTLEELCRYVKAPEHGIWIDTVKSVAAYVARQREARAASGPLEQKVEDLLARMTLEEKIGQLNMPCVYVNELGKDIPAKMEACRKFAEGTYEAGIGPGGGFFTLANTILHKGPRQQAEFFNELQKIAIENTRLKIPLLQTEEGTHGLMCSGATIFPEGLALGSSWNIPMLKQIYSAAAREARAVGIHQLFTLVIEPNRDPRLGRNQEGYSEDPFLCARIAEAIVEGVQGTDVAAADKAVAGFCHYPGQSQPVGGLERGAMEISPRLLREMFLPPWVAGIRTGGALGVMATYPAIDGVPVHGSEEILTRILRGELGFEGLVLSEGSGISTLIYEGLAPDQKVAGQLAIKAGVDVGISYEKGYMQDLIASVEEGKVPMEVIDRSVRRILRQKFRLGLFDHPYVDPGHAEHVSRTPEHVSLARQAAREGIVLLKNEGGLLPLDRNVKSIAVIGPNADYAKNQLGDYTSIAVLQKVVTVLDGIRAKVSAGTRVTYVRGCDVVGTKLNEITKAAEAAKNADVAIVVVGENEWRSPGRTGTNGEAYDAATLELTGLQEELVKAVHATGTRTVVVLINGRPLALRWIAEHVQALLEPWICGEEGGNAVADVLFGDCNPSGRLPITIPRHVGQLPIYYNYPPSKAYWLKNAWGRPYADLNPEPLYEFGYGLSYTTFEYSNPKVEQPRIEADGKVTVRLEVANTGRRKGEEVVQLYLRDPISTVTTPVKQLRGFQKISLEPGEKKTVAFTLEPEHLALLNRHLEWVVEPGRFEVMMGRSSKDIRLTGSFEVVEGGRKP
jgi:beta-glucosidase